ncbi:restriction endonuclease subunit S [Sulfitobacter sp. LCG007]
MNADRLLALYEKVAEAPDAVPHLRRFVLDLAVRGKLVPHDTSEGQGAVLLKQIADAWKARLASGEIKKIKKWQKVSAEDVPFDVPSNWALVRLGEAMDLINGRAFKPSDWTQEGLPIVRIQNLNNASAPFNRFDGEVRPRFLIDTGDFLISWSGTPGTSFGAHIWDRGPAVLNQHIFKAMLLGEAFEKAFLKIAINSRLLELIEQAHGGVGLQHITKPKLESVALTLPPLAEQRRIVAKVEELMALLDRLEAARGQREVTRARLTAASLARLTVSDTGPDADPADFPANARFALATLPALTTRPDQIKPLRQTILNLAVRGKLVDQDPTDEPVSSLVERICSEQKAAKKQRVEPDMTLVDFSIPSHWIWQSLDRILTDGPQNGLSPAKSERKDAPKAITLTATTSGAFDAQQFKNVDVSLADAARYWLEPGDLLFQRGNTREYVGMAAIYDGPPETFLFPDLIMRVKISPHVDIRFAHLWCIAPFARHFLSANATGAQQTMPKINQSILRSLPIPLPPLAEQHRIVAKVDALMAICDRLAAALATADSTRARLLEALLADALNPASMREMEAAE